LVNKKKILIVSECFYPEEFKINDVALCWVKKGYEVDVLTLIPTYPLGKPLEKYNNSFYLKERINGINIIRLRAVLGYNKSRFKKIFKYIQFMIMGSIAALFIGRKYDHIFGFNLGALSDMLPAVLIRKIYKTPLTIWVQDLWPDSVYAYGFQKTKLLSFLLNLLVRFIYSNADNIAISSRGFKSKLLEYTQKKQKFFYVPNWADDLNMELNPIKYSVEKKIHFTFAGNIGKVQNLENIINAFSNLPKSHLKKTQLNIVGEGSNLASIKLLKKGDAPVVFHGKVERERISRYLMGSDFLIISLIDKPIFAKTVPAKLQTYIKAKKPIIAIIKGETSKIIKDYNLGLCAEPNDLTNITNTFKECIDMSETAKNNFILNNEKLSNNVFDKNKILDKLTKILN